MRETQSWNTLGYEEKCLMASKASLNASILDSDGSMKKLINYGIDITKISTLGEYLANQKREENSELDNDKIEDLSEDKNLARTFVVPVILSNGQEIEVIVNKDGQDIACMYKDEEGNLNSFSLTPRMKEQIEKAFEGDTLAQLENIIGEKSLEEIKSEYLPENVDELAENVSNDELSPNNKQILKKVNEKNGINIEEQEEREDQEKEIPEEIRDVIAKICSENNLDIKDVKEVMEVPPERISDSLEKTGIQENDGNVICLGFRDAGQLKNRVVMVQGDTVVDDRAYDTYMNDYMNEHKGTSKINNIEDEHDKLEYTDLDGNTTICDITREPRDLNCTDKEYIQKQMEELDEEAKNILNSDAPIEEKTQRIISVNARRLNTFKEYGISVPLVEDEIQADIEISEDIQEEVETNEEIEEDKTNEEQEDEHYMSRWDSANPYNRH